MKNNNEEKVVKYKKGQIGFLEQQLKKTLLKANPEASQTEIDMVAKIGYIIATSDMIHTSQYDIDDLVATLKKHQTEAKEKQVAKLEKQLADLKGQ